MALQQHQAELAERQAQVVALTQQLAVAHEQQELLQQVGHAGSSLTVLQVCMYVCGASSSLCTNSSIVQFQVSCWVVLRIALPNGSMP